MDRASMSEDRETDIVQEAQYIIDRYATTVNRVVMRQNRRKEKSSSDGHLWFIAGTLISAAIFLAVFLKVY